MEARRVELLSEDQTTKTSPSAVHILTFPPACSHGQDHAFSSLIKSHAPQSLDALVPCFYDAGWPRRRRLGADARGLSRESYVFVVVSSFLFPVFRRFRAAARYPCLPYPRRNQIRPHFNSVRSDNARPFLNIIARLLSIVNLTNLFIHVHACDVQYPSPYPSLPYLPVCHIVFYRDIAPIRVSFAHLLNKQTMELWPSPVA